MPDKSFTTELDRVMARPDAAILIRQIDAYAAHHGAGDNDWPDELAEDFSEIISCYDSDPDKALAYVVLAIDRSDDAEFLNYLGCGPLEDVLRNPSQEMLSRVVAEARRSPRFRWILSSPFKVAISDEAWRAIEPFRITGPHEEPSPDTMPGR